jgi:hypothetical protein
MALIGKDDALYATVAVIDMVEWKQANGALRDMVCRGLLLMIHRAGAAAALPG